MSERLIKGKIPVAYKKFRIGIGNLLSTGQASNLLLSLYAEVGSKTTKTNQALIANATKKSSDTLMHKGVVSDQKPQSSSQLTGRSDRRLEVQRPLVEGIG